MRSRQLNTLASLIPGTVALRWFSAEQPARVHAALRGPEDPRPLLMRVLCRVYSTRRRFSGVRSSVWTPGTPKLCFPFMILHAVQLGRNETCVRGGLV